MSEKYNPTQKVIIVKANNRGIYPSAFSIIAGLILEIIYKHILIIVKKSILHKDADHNSLQMKQQLQLS